MKTTINNIVKKTTLITVIIFGLGIYSIAGTNGPEMTMNKNAAKLEILVPSTPAEADFDEMIPEAMINLAPVTPAYADFNDNDQTVINYKILAPVTPKEADFTENL